MKDIKDMQIKLFTHTDLDGVGCAILAKEVFEENVNIEYCDYNNINERVEKFLNEEIDLYDILFITDISINESLAERINNLFNNDKLHIIKLLDHHPTALDLNKYKWCEITIEKHGEKTSGTRMFYDYLLEKRFLYGTKSYNWDHSVNLLKFVEKVKRYDTWLWKEKYNDVEAKLWNDLLYIIGREDFIKSVLHKIEYTFELEFDETETKILECKQKEIDKYIDKKQKEIIEKDILNYKAGIVFAEQYHSELGNKLSENNPHLDFIVIINMSYGVSYRTIKDNIDLGKDIAKVYGGGGHPKAAGSSISDVIRENVINMLFKI
ncbi:MAG: DHH family phosphoesterase [Bacilli bacterium]